MINLRTWHVYLKTELLKGNTYWFTILGLGSGLLFWSSSCKHGNIILQWHQLPIAKKVNLGDKQLWNLHILYVALLKQEGSIKPQPTNSVPPQGFWRCTVYITGCCVQKLGTADTLLSTFMSHSSPKNIVRQSSTQVWALFWALVNIFFLWAYINKI